MDSRDQTATERTASMLHPVGPLPGSTYWRRRSVLLAAVVITVVLVKGVLLSGGSSDATTPRTQPPVHRPAQLTPAHRPAQPTPAHRPAQPTPAHRPAQPTPAHRPAQPTLASSTTHCSTGSLKLLVGSARDAYRVGTVVDLTISVLNMSDTTCRSELGPRVQAAAVYHGSRRLWSSNDCYPGSTSSVATLRPGELRRLVIRWSGNTSAPGCGGKPVRVGAGRYAVVGRVGSLTGRGTVVLR